MLANDIGEAWRTGMLAICTRYRDGLRRVDAAALGDGERVTYDVFAFRLDTCVTGFFISSEASRGVLTSCSLPVFLRSFKV